MKTFYTKEYTNQNEFFWKRLCITDNNESHGLMERFLQQLQVEYKVEGSCCNIRVSKLVPKDYIDQFYSAASGDLITIIYGDYKSAFIKKDNRPEQFEAAFRKIQNMIPKIGVK